MEEPIIYSIWASQFLETPSGTLFEDLRNAIMLDDKDEFLELIKDPEFERMRQYHRSRYMFLREVNADMILKDDSPQIAMALINGETRGIIDDPQLVFKDGWTPLHLASVTPSPKLINYLIQRGDSLDVSCDYAPLNLKQATPLDLALQVIDTGYKNGRYLRYSPWTLRSSIFELFHYVCQLQKHSLEVIRLLVQNTQDKERVRKAFFDAANEGKLVTVAALFLTAPELFLSTSLEGGSMSPIDKLNLNLNSLEKRTDIQDALLLLLDVFDLVGHMLIAYVRLDDPKVWELSAEKKSGFFLREAADMKLGISSRDDYLLRLFKPVSPDAVDPPYLTPNQDGNELQIGYSWNILPFPMKREDIDIGFVNRFCPCLEPHEADDLRKAIDNKLSIMPNICNLSESTTRLPIEGGKQRSSFPCARSIEVPRARSFCSAAAIPKRTSDFKLIPGNGWKSQVMNPTKLESFISAVRLTHFPMIAKRLMK